MSTAASDVALARDALAINLSWLIRLRWGAAAGQLLTIGVAYLVLDVDLPLTPLLSMVGVALLTNAAWTIRLARGRAAGPWEPPLLLALDVMILTGLLFFTGGPFNPFSTLYLVYVALAAVVCRPTWTWALATLALGAFAILFIEDLLPASEVAAGMSHGHMGMHLEGMWVAFGVAAAFIVYFVQRIAGELRRREQELLHAQQKAERSERLASLATLAAGAAHELSTPLSTIAVVASELERQLDRQSVAEGVHEDVRLIQDSVRRCRDILEQLASDAGESTGESFETTTPAALVAQATDSLSGRDRVRTHLDSSDLPALVVPCRAVARVLRGIVKNALQASPDGTPIEIRATSAPERCRLQVRDFGTGMDAQTLARASEPFFTTKAPGKGMGLGLFLARAVVEQLGGEIELQSEPGAGTTVTLSLPTLAESAT